MSIFLLSKEYQKKSQKSRECEKKSWPGPLVKYQTIQVGWVERSETQHQREKGRRGVGEWGSGGVGE